MRKLISSKLTIIIMVLALMMATTAVSFVYWKTGLVGSEKESRPEINIGTGSDLDSLISFDSVSFDADKELIPQYRDATGNEVTSLSIKYDVRWSADLPSGVGELESWEKIGQLTVTCTSILVGGVEFLDTKGAGGLDLFVINDISTNITVNDTTATTVTIIIKLNEPANKVQYEQIAGKNVIFTFSFSVISQHDAAQL